MHRFRLPVSALMVTVVVIAFDAAIIRSLYNSNDVIGVPLTMVANRAVFAFGVFPVASLLIFVALVRIPEIVRRRGESSFFFGFETLGWAAIFLFVAVGILAPRYIDLCLAPGLRLFQYGIQWMVAVIPSVLNRLPAWFEEIFECGPVIILLGLPELGLALIGGWLARQAGISIRIEAHRAPGTQNDSTMMSSALPSIKA